MPRACRSPNTSCLDQPRLTPPSQQEVEKTHILRVLEAMKGNRTQAAAVLEISIRTLRNKLNEFRIGDEKDSEVVSAEES